MVEAVVTKEQSPIRLPAESAVEEMVMETRQVKPEPQIPAEAEAEVLAHLPAEQAAPASSSSRYRGLRDGSLR